jgi:hypothetical protein
MESGLTKKRQAVDARKQLQWRHDTARDMSLLDIILRSISRPWETSAAEEAEKRGAEGDRRRDQGENGVQSGDRGEDVGLDSKKRRRRKHIAAGRMGKVDWEND